MIDDIDKKTHYVTNFLKTKVQLNEADGRAFAGNWSDRRPDY